MSIIKKPQPDLDAIVRVNKKWDSAYMYVYVLFDSNNVRKHPTVVFTNTSQECYYCFTKENVEARKAELQGKPKWADIHKCINYIAQNENGEWRMFTIKPKITQDLWSNIHDDGGWYPVCRGEVIGDWKDTLEERPVENSVQESFLVVGEDYEIKPYWRIVTITCKHVLEGEYRTVFWNHAEQRYVHTTLPEDKLPEHFRPVKSDRDKWIDLVEEKTGLSVPKGTSGAIYDEVVVKYYTKM